jgi:purine-nucleoside phosphorylase
MSRPAKTASAKTAVEILHARGLAHPIDLGLVLGTGLGGIASLLDAPLIVPYADLPGFPQSTVSGHAGQLVIGKRQGKTLACLQGRAHFYETGDPAAMAAPLETLAALGAQILIVTCAAGSVSPDLKPGMIALIADHINFSGTNPLIGLASDDRFVSLVNAYDSALLSRFEKAARDAQVPLRHGVYMWFSGPSFETAAEIRMARLLGADLVGMSMVPEVILARRLGLHVTALATITNFGTGFSGGAPTHDETKQVAASTVETLKNLILHFLDQAETAA